MKLKIFSDRSFLPGSLRHGTMLYPFWGKNAEDPEELRYGYLDSYIDAGAALFEMVSLEACDLAVLPGSWGCIRANPEALALAERFAQQVRRAGKPLLVFFEGDTEADVPFENAVVFKNSLFASQRKRNEFAIPAWSQDFTQKYLAGHLPIRRKQAKPVVSFCGYAPPYGLPWGKQKLQGLLRLGASFAGITRRFPAAAGHSARARALHAHSHNKRVETRLIARDKFAFSMGGSLLPGGRENAQTFRDAFLSNMIESDYVICARGYGNYSLRLYEALSCGRIPILINTDCVLPYDFAIDWKQHCLWVEERDLSSLGDRVADYHAALSGQQYVERQHECRRLWDEWLSPVAFFANLHRHLPIARVESVGV